MAYMVGTGKLKNGLVLVPILEHAVIRDEEQVLLNYVAIAAKQMKEKSNMSKILLFEWNSSNGVNTQRATYDDTAILYISIHDKIPWRSYQEHGKSHECGSQNAEGLNINIQLNAFASDVDYLAAFRTVIMPIARDFSPEVVLASGEFDAEISLKLREFFGYMISELMSLANGKVVLIAEEEYRFSSAERCLKTFLGKEITPIKEDQYRPRICTLQALERTINIQLKYWPCLQSHLTKIHTLLSEAQKEDNTRQEMAAVCNNFRTALSFNTATCTEHDMLIDHVGDLDGMRSWLELNSLIFDFELLRSRRATLKEIESFYFYSNVLSDFFHRRKPVMKLRELPCGCFEDGWTGDRITVNSLTAAGCVIDMTYRVGTGLHKNGLVFVPVSERYFKIDSDAFQLDFAAIAAEQMKENLGMKRILIFHWNASNRMSTQGAAYDDKAILCISIRDKEQCGSADTEGFNVNIVLDRQGGAEYMAAFRNIVMPIAREFNPEIVLASGGYDIIQSMEFFGPMISELMSLANGKVVFLFAKLWQYKAAEMCLKALLGEEITPFKEEQLQEVTFTSDDLESLERTLKIQLKYWPCLQKYHSKIKTLLRNRREYGGSVFDVKKTWSMPATPLMAISPYGRTTHAAFDKHYPIVKGASLEMEHGTKLISASDGWTTYETFDEHDPIVKGASLKMEHGPKLNSATDGQTTHEAFDEHDSIVKGASLKMEHKDTPSVRTRNKCHIL